MSTALAIALLAVVTVGWFLLALAPALGELHRRTDVEPLRLRRGGGDVRHFALGFGRFVTEELAALAPASRERPATGGVVLLRSGEPAWHIPRGLYFVTLPVQRMPDGALATHVVLSEAELAVPEGTSLLKELYVASELRGGADCFYRAVLTRGDARLGARSGVLRWIDAGGLLVAAEGCTLSGRASAGRGMRLGDGVSFQRVAAPTITFGTPRGAPTGRMTPAGGIAVRSVERESSRVASASPGSRAERESLAAPHGVTDAFGRWLVEGDFDVPADAFVASDLVVTGTLRVGAGARIGGAVKCAVLEGGVRATYDGAVVATGRVVLGMASEVAGPIVVEGEAWLGGDCRVGTLAEPTTISAVMVRVGHGAVVCGEIWARREGEVDGPATHRPMASGGWDVAR